MKIRLKLFSQQGGADLSTKRIDLDKLIGQLQKLRDEGSGEIVFDAMCDDWHRNRGNNPGGRHAAHHGKLNILCVGD